MSKFIFVLVQILFLFSLSCSSFRTLEKAEEVFTGPQFNFDNAPVLNDRQLSAYLTSLLSRIEGKYPGISVGSIVIKDSDIAQAMATRDGIFISKAMLFAIQDEAELISVLGHEFFLIKMAI